MNDGEFGVKGSAEENSPFDVLVVGAGFAGMYALYELRRRGFSVVVVEAGSDVGGTWYWNRYPGARCDVESMQYSYSFSPELEQDWKWNERYAAQPEILRYASHVADRFDLKRDIHFNVRVRSASFDEECNLWTVTTDTGEQILSRYCIMATGCLSLPREPNIRGLSSFEGARYHTARWPREGVDFTGMRVGVIGTGSTGIQAIPQFAKQAKHLYVFQRTANYSVPAKNRPLDEHEVAEFKSRYREHRQRMRTSGSGTLWTQENQSALDILEGEREEIFEANWNRGGPGLVQVFPDLGRDLSANETLAKFVRTKICQAVSDPVTANALAPNDHPIGTKRICVDIEYFETYNRKNVTLIDLKGEPVEEITPDGVETSAASYKLDCLVFATGFDAITGALQAIDIRGCGGKSLREKWAGGPRTYLGLATAGFPNLFMVTGPGSPSVLSNMFVSIEQHIEWIADCLIYLRKNEMDFIDANSDFEDRWVSHVNDLAEQTLFSHAKSWYLGANVPGKPRVFMPYVGGVGAYREKCEQVARDSYEGFTTTAAVKWQ
ncbi:flavin-containing monooxygenase [Paraburkholderia sediminicola]|uniref:flavin-containing monooxygenase n=1 Tax=Paraburkholderia sediminicola TaxID=458836 RepID=UPI0038B7D760